MKNGKYEKTQHTLIKSSAECLFFSSIMQILTLTDEQDIFAEVVGVKHLGLEQTGLKPRPFDGALPTSHRTSCLLLQLALRVSHTVGSFK